MKENPKAFIPAWLDDAGLSRIEFRLYCHLCRRADNTTGIAWPSYKAMIQTCGGGKMTIRRSLETLAKRGLIEKVGKPFGGSCRYKVNSTIVPSEGQLDSNSPTTDTIEDTPIVPPQNRNSPTTDPSIVPPQGQEGYPLKVNQGRESTLSAIADESDLFGLDEPAPHKTANPLQELAERIYQEYPRKVAKPNGIKAILKAMKKKTPAFLLERTQAYALAVASKEKNFIPHPATWFNDERYNDDPAEWNPSSQPSKPTTSTVNLGRRK